MPTENKQREMFMSHTHGEPRATERQHSACVCVSLYVNIWSTTTYSRNVAGMQFSLCMNMK